MKKSLKKTVYLRTFYFLSKKSNKNFVVCKITFKIKPTKCKHFLPKFQLMKTGGKLYFHGLEHNIYRRKMSKSEVSKNCETLQGTPLALCVHRVHKEKWRA